MRQTVRHLPMDSNKEELRLTWTNPIAGFCGAGSHRIGTFLRNGMYDGTVLGRRRFVRCWRAAGCDASAIVRGDFHIARGSRRLTDQSVTGISLHRLGAAGFGRRSPRISPTKRLFATLPFGNRRVGVSADIRKELIDEACRFEISSDRQRMRFCHGTVN